VREGNAWNAVSVLTILKNTALYGSYRFGDATTGATKTRRVEHIPIALPPEVTLITEAEYDALQKQMENNKKYSGPWDRRQGWPLQGLIVSEACGLVYRSKFNGLHARQRAEGRTPARVYRCGGHLARLHRGVPCTCKALPAEATEKKVADILRRMLTDPALREKAVADYIGNLEGAQASLAARLRPCEEEIARIDARMDDLTMDMRDGRLSRPRYDTEVARLREQRARESSRRADLGNLEAEYARVTGSLDAIRKAVDEGLLHVTVLGAQGAYTWFREGEPDDEECDPGHHDVRTEGLAELVQRLQLRILARPDGTIQIAGMMGATDTISALPG
jgi:hypothetical protein